jgi:hypothetical protein
MDLPTLEEWAVLHVQRAGGIRRWAERSYDFRAVVLQGDTLLVAAGDDGIGVLRIPPRPADLAARPRREHHSLAMAEAIPIENVRFIPVPAGRVIDVVPVDEGRVFAVVEVRGGGLFARSRLDVVQVSLAA